MTAVLDGAAALGSAVRSALDTVFDPELDEPITDLGFVRSIAVEDEDEDGATVTVHLRLPTSFCAPNFAWLMASDAREAVRTVDGVRDVTVELDDHHDSHVINSGLAAGADFRTTFGEEAEHDLEALRLMFRRKAHTAAMERAVASWLSADPARSEAEVARLVLADLPPGRVVDALIRRRAALGWAIEPGEPVLLNDQRCAVAAADVPRWLRRARSVRVSIDGNAHFCRGLLATRYPGAEADQTPRPDDDGAARHVLTLTPAAKGAPA